MTLTSAIYTGSKVTLRARTEEGEPGNEARKFACNGRKFPTGVGRILNFTSCVGSMIPALSLYISIGFPNYIGTC